MNVKLIRISSGEDLISNVTDMTDSVVTVEDPIVGFPSREGTIGFAPWSPMISKSEKHINIPRQFIVYIAEPDDKIVEQYEKMFGAVITPSKKIIV